METALHRIGQKARGDTTAANEDNQVAEVQAPAAATTKTKPKSRKRTATSASSRTRPSPSAHDSDTGDNDHDDAAPKRKVRKVVRKAKATGEPMFAEDETDSI